MDFNRAAEHLWSEWFGYGYESTGYKSVTYFTVGHVNLQNSVVLGGLASALQRDGLVDSIGQGRNAIEVSSIHAHGLAGSVDGDVDLTICDVNGETFYGDEVDQITEITMVEVFGLGYQ
jgi:hypothetical protein